jgi:multiple antibiotic resistance protein
MLFGDIDSDAVPPKPGRDIAVFPLAVPSIAGPGTIMAVIVLTDNDVYTIPEQALTSLMLLAVLVITCVLFLLSEKVLRLIGRAGASILIRVMGIILAALSVELVMGALGIGVWAGAKH